MAPEEPTSPRADRSAKKLAAYAWTSPNSLIGLLLALPMLLFGARVRLVRGVVEVFGGRVGAMLTSRALPCPYRAITFGHVILATGGAALDAARKHEHVHVRQYERWGAFFLPAYVASSAWQLLCGRRCYRDNWFERQAYAGESEQNSRGTV